MDDLELVARFKTYDLSKTQLAEVQSIKADALRLATKIDRACSDSREKSQAITLLEDTVMWATKAIARNGRR